MRRVTVVPPVLVAAVLVLTLAVTAGRTQAAAGELFPEVRKLIEGSTLAPDPDEPAEAIRLYLEGSRTLHEADKQLTFGRAAESRLPFDPERHLADAHALMRQATEQYPESRHAWEGLGQVLWVKAEHSGRSDLLRQAVEAKTRAVDLILQKDSYVPLDLDHLIALVAVGLSRLKDGPGLDRFFDRLRDRGDIWEFARAPYASALSTLGDPRAEELYREGIEGDTDPTSRNAQQCVFADYLYDRERYLEALEILEKLPAQTLRTYNGYLLKGTILEKLGRDKEAMAEYDRYRAEQADRKSISSLRLLAPLKYRIPGSLLQEGIDFEAPTSDSGRPGAGLLGRVWEWLVPVAQAGHVTTPCASTDDYCKAKYYLRYAIAGEASAIHTQYATLGMQRAVAWNIRTRVFGGDGFIQCSARKEWCYKYASSVAYNCTDLTTVWKRYYAVIDTGAYRGLSTGKSRWDSDPQLRIEVDKVIADAIESSKAPDPIYGRCASGSGYTGSLCEGLCNVDSGPCGAFPNGGVEFRRGILEWKTSLTCRYQQLVSDGAPTGGFCGINCFNSMGVVCPKKGCLAMTGPCFTNACKPSGSYSQGYPGPIRGNFYWSGP